MNELTDTDPMPFGQHRRTPMQDVPAAYLHYLWTNGLKANLPSRTDQGRVARYIEKNMDALKKEHPDGIWS